MKTPHPLMNEITEKYTKKLNRVVMAWVGIKNPKQNVRLHANDFKDFAKFIGYVEPLNSYGNPESGFWVNILRPEVQEIIDALDGPHTATMLKVLEIRNECRPTSD